VGREGRGGWRVRTGVRRCEQEVGMKRRKEGGEWNGEGWGGGWGGEGDGT